MSLQSSHQNDAEKYYAVSNVRGYCECAVTLIIFLSSLYLSYSLFQKSIWLGVIVIPLLSLTLGRIFALMHDCTHYSLFKDRKINTIIGRVFGVIVLTPFAGWQWQHIIHHRTVGDLKERAVGGVFFSTVNEYRAFNLREKIFYKLLHHPILFFFLFAQVYFFILLRFNRKNHILHPLYNAKINRSIVLNNFSVLLFLLSLCCIFGFKFALIILLPMYWLTQFFVTWFFFVQHIYPEAYYENGKKIILDDDIFSCTSFYKLPRLLAWFSMNIGYHHIHHLHPRIPGYNLVKFFLQNHHLQKNTMIVTLKKSISLYQCVLYDEKQNRFISWREYRRLIWKY